MYYIGLDVHKRKISYCVKDASGLGAAPKQMVGAVSGRSKTFLRGSRAALPVTNRGGRNVAKPSLWGGRPNCEVRHSVYVQANVDLFHS